MKERKREQGAKTRIKNGSLTVEASFLISFLLVLVFSILGLSLFLHDRSVLASCAAEAAGKGAQKKYVKEAELESWVAEEARGLASGRLLALREFEVKAKTTGGKVTVSYSGRTGLLGGLEIRGQEEAKRLKTVEWIRGSRQLKELWES